MQVTRIVFKVALAESGYYSVNFLRLTGQTESAIGKEMSEAGSVSSKFEDMSDNKKALT